MTNVDHDDDVEDILRCELSVPNEDPRGEELRSGAKHCTHLFTIARIRWGWGGSPLPNPVQRLAVSGLKMDQPLTSVTKFVL